MLNDPILTRIVADDPISSEGVRAQLRREPGIALVPDGDPADVAVVVGDAVNDALLGVVRCEAADGRTRVLLVVSRADDQAILDAIEAGAVGLLRRSESDSLRLAAAVLASAHGDGTLPPDLLGRLLGAVGRLQRQMLLPNGVGARVLAEREIDVLRLVADGYDTAEIADKLCYSERTIKNVLHAVTTRLNARNRSHAVAYALRQGLIA